MAFVKQVWTLMSKNFRSMLFRHLSICIWMAFVVPVVLSAFFSFAKNLFVPYAKFGVSDPHGIMSLGDAFHSAHGSGRDKLVLVNNGFSGGAIDQVLSEVERITNDAKAGIDVVRIDHERDLVTECRSSLRGSTKCFSALVMRSSPKEGPGQIWNYTIRTDASFYDSPIKISVDKSDNPEQVYLLPLQHVVDGLIADVQHPNSANKLKNVRQFPFTSLTPSERDDKVREVYHQAIVNFMGVAFIATVIWITYHLTGFVATERESGMSQLIDAMMPTRWPFLAQAARIIAHHLSFSIIYLPAWVIGSLVIRFGVFANTSVLILLILHILTGLAFASMSILFASFFKKAQLSGITATLSILLLGILAQSLTDPGTATVAILSVLFAPCSYVFSIIQMAEFEKHNKAAGLIHPPKDASFQISGIAYWIFLVIQIIAYPLIGALVERSFYGTSSKGRQVLTNPNDAVRLGDNAVVLQDFSKIYKPSLFGRLISLGSKPKEPVVAVDKLSFEAGRGQIICLLGANGSGKSTTLDAVAGLHKLTSGSISIDGTSGIGIAPQKNVLWDDLTVREHIRIFNRLKSPRNTATKAEIDDLIRAVDLWPKRNSLAKTLSGGQKRKLQLGMMLTGGSAVCCVDEVSSGIDALSRRKIWDILLAERGNRTIILTTHYLDEADLLADHIAILSKGTLRAAGSSVQLKDTLGGGYRVHVYKEEGVKLPSVEGVETKNEFELVTYVAPSSSLAAQVIKQLQAAGLHDYRFSGPTIEDVFLALAEEIKDDATFRGNEKRIASPDTPSDDNISQDSANQAGLKLKDGKRVGYMRQAMILFGKRVTVFKRSWILYFVAFILPIIAAGLTSLFIKGKSQTGCTPADRASESNTQDAFTQVDDMDKIKFLAGPPSGVSIEDIAGLLAPIFKGASSGAAKVGTSALNNLKTVDTFKQFDDYIKNNRKNVTTGFWFGDDNNPPTFAWVGNLVFTSALTSQQFFDVILTNTSIATTWQPFDVPFTPGIGDALNLAIYMGIALSVYPAFFALYPSNERRRFVRALQYSNGVRPLPLWMAYLGFDFLIALVSSAVVTAIWAGLSDIWYHISYIFVVFFLYGLASILLGYIISLFTKSSLATFAWAAVGQAVFFLGYLIAYVCILTYVEVSKIDDTLILAHFVISIFAPVGSAMRALFLATNLFSAACDGAILAKNPGGLLQYGGPILYLIVQSFVYFGLLIWLDSGNPGSSLRSLFRRNVKTDGVRSDDPEIVNEIERVKSGAGNDDGLRVMNLTKSFGKNTAVDNVTFGIKRSEVFALLGPNGAGKSTTISLIRGDLKPSRNGGDILVDGASVVKHIADARRNMGVCPQTDAIDDMTVDEHLRFYAKVRGVPDAHNVTAILQAVGLGAYSERMGQALSGGNKRKLSLGIALMGNPAVLLLDEPTSSLDPASAINVRRTVQAIVPNRSILLTTHSMEEADALASRVGIMARRMLALGTPDNLRGRFGDALHVHLVSNTAPRTSVEEMDSIMAWIKQRLPSARVEDKSYHGQTRFAVAAEDVLALMASGHPSRGSNDEKAISNANHSAIGLLVVLLEENKRQLGISHFSVSPTTLDQVFLSVVGQHNVQEENYEEKKPSVWGKILRFGS